MFIKSGTKEYTPCIRLKETINETNDELVTFYSSAGDIKKHNVDSILVPTTGFYPNVSKIKIPKIYWATNINTQLKHHLEYCKNFDMVLVSQKRTLKAFKKINKNTHLFEHAYDHRIFKPVLINRETPYDISFIGKYGKEMYKERKEYILFLLTNFKTHITKNSYLTKAWLEIQKGKLAFNHNVKRNWMNMRNVEVLGMGMPLVTSKIEGYSYIDGENCIMYDSKKELRDKIYYYLNNYNEALEIGKNGYKLVYPNETYTNRWKQLKELINCYL